MQTMLNTIAELPAYISFAEKHLSEEERQGVIDYLAEHPKAGDVMRGTGGCASCAGARADEVKVAE